MYQGLVVIEANLFEQEQFELEISLKVINTPRPRSIALQYVEVNEGNEVNTKFVYWSITKEF